MFKNGECWRDTSGEVINAHGGGMLCHEGMYYWYGEHKIATPLGNTAQVGVHVYVSDDLYAWRDAGVALAVDGDPESPLPKGCVLERPKVLHCPSTGKFVMRFHFERDTRYTEAHSGVAVADRPEGPFRFAGSGRVNAGHWPRNAHPDMLPPGLEPESWPEKDPRLEAPHSGLLWLKRDLGDGQQARDFNVFQDADGTAWHIYSSEKNHTLHLAELTPDYLGHTGKYFRLFPDRFMEAAAFGTRPGGGGLFMVASGCTGWAPNAARGANAAWLTGDWLEQENPCRGKNPANNRGPELTFGAQSTYAFEVGQRPGLWIVMFDEWRPDNPIDGRYHWLPVVFGEDGTFSLTWQNWDWRAYRG